MRVLPLLLAACAAHTPPGNHDDPEPGSDACGAAEQVVSFTTTDGVRLVADLWPAATANAPGIVLLHMAPPSNNRTGFPPRVRRQLHEAGWNVLNVDRRGAGDSEGKAPDATAAPQARLDVEASVSFLTDAGRGCEVRSQAVVLVGASNGTTAAYDYASDHDPGLVSPAAMVFLSPGSYTIQNHGASKADLGEAWQFPVPLLWLYPTNEPFSKDFVTDAPASWKFTERGTQHGTRMFDGGALEDATVQDLVAFLTAALAAVP